MHCALPTESDSSLEASKKGKDCVRTVFLVVRQITIGTSPMGKGRRAGLKRTAFNWLVVDDESADWSDRVAAAARDGVTGYGIIRIIEL